MFPLLSVLASEHADGAYVPQLQLLDVSRRLRADSLCEELRSVEIERSDDGLPVLNYAEFEQDGWGDEFYALLRSARFPERARAHVCALMRMLERMIELKDELLEQRRCAADLLDRGFAREDPRVVLAEREIVRIKRHLHDEEWAWMRAVIWLRTGWLHEWRTA